MKKIATFAAEHKEQIHLVVNATVLIASTIAIAGIIKEAVDSEKDRSEAPAEAAV